MLHQMNRCRPNMILEGAASCNLRINRFAWQIVDRARGVDGEA